MCHMSSQLKDSLVKCMVWVCVRCGGKGGGNDSSSWFFVSGRAAFDV